MCHFKVGASVDMNMNVDSLAWVLTAARVEAIAGGLLAPVLFSLSILGDVADVKSTALQVFLFALSWALWQTTQFMGPADPWGWPDGS